MRLRFAPSPTGSLHVGSARTAIMNQLVSVANNGTLILRIEDTDVSRSTEESTNAILSTLKWLGVSYGEGPFFQSSREKLYSKYIKKLISEGKAYCCFCTQEELEEMRTKQLHKHISTGYDGRCSKLSQEEVAEKISQNLPYVVRLKIPPEKLMFNDLIKGIVEFDGKLLHDIIILRSNGSPTYNLAVVVDDHEMNISHVIRGEDHVSNTPKQIAIYNALGLEAPIFAHIPLIIGADRSKLSKRHCDTAIEDYQKKGFLPEALVNYFSLLGYSHDANNEIMTLENIAKTFSFSSISKSPSMFDLKKLTWMNNQYIRMLSDKELYDKAKSFCKDIPLEEKKIKKILLLSKDQLKVLSDIKEICAPFCSYKIDWDQKKVVKLLKKERILDFLKEFIEKLEILQDFSLNSLEILFDTQLGLDSIKKRDAAQIIRFASTGKLISPPLFDTLYLLGQQEIIIRMNQFLQEVPCQEKMY
ncbi:MAG: glutamate--tRNA ligase [Caldisericia bacterium]|nr:glutamate--tRNA ligase [Caldisericia bacterium]